VSPASVVSGPVPLSSRGLMIITVILLVAVAVAAVIVWWVTRQPPLTPIEVPSVSVA
jgi:Na+/serine symporter